jgi:peptidyl-dipeptidase Dcp
MNPLLRPFSGPLGLPAFQEVLPEHFQPAFSAAMAEHRRELAVIAHQPEAPSFTNTVAALDGAGRWLARVRSLFNNLCSSVGSEPLLAVQRQMAAPLAAHDSAVVMDAALFGRLDVLHRQRHALGLDAASLRLLERFYMDFVREGAQLQGAARTRYAQLAQALAEAYTRFSQNLLHDENEFTLPLPDDAALAGLPASLRLASEDAARLRGLPEGSHVLTLARSMVVPFLTHSPRRDLREALWRAWVARGEHPGQHDNRPVLALILRLRQEQARLLGFAHYADYALADRMARTPAAAQRLLDEVWSRALTGVQSEQEDLLAIRRAAGIDEQVEGPIQPWDWRFWAEVLRKQRYALDDAELKPYFALPNMVQAAFDCAQRLFGLHFEARPDWPVYHPDVRAYEVTAANGRTVGVFLHDNFARPGKRSGAWMSSLRVQSHAAPEGLRLPIVLNNNNFARGTPALLSQDDVRTLFHEFGHGLHGLLSDVQWAGLSGTAVLRDFVELPSQIFEHWGFAPQVLKRHARHIDTGAPIPDELIERMVRAEHFNSAYDTVRYTASALTDLALHSMPEPPADPVAWEAAFLAERGLPPACGLNHRLPHFQHLFAGDGYAAGYYVYLWAEVLDADGFQAFTEAGDVFEPVLARALLHHIYASGNSVAPDEAFRAFRGRDPQIVPLLHQRGLVPQDVVPA